MNATLLPLLGAFGLGGSEIIIGLVGLAFTAFWVWMIVDCATNEESGTTKIVWILIILFAGCVGAPIYYFVRKMPRDKS